MPPFIRSSASLGRGIAIARNGKTSMRAALYRAAARRKQLMLKNKAIDIK